MFRYQARICSFEYSPVSSIARIVSFTFPRSRSSVRPERSSGRISTFLTSCCVIDEPPDPPRNSESPMPKFSHAARSSPRTFTPSFSQNDASSVAIVASIMCCETSCSRTGSRSPSSGSTNSYNSAPRPPGPRES